MSTVSSFQVLGGILKYVGLLGARNSPGTVLDKVTDE